MWVERVRWFQRWLGICSVLAACSQGNADEAQLPQEPVIEPPGGRSPEDGEGPAPTGEFPRDAARQEVSVTLPPPELGPLAEELVSALATSPQELAAKHAVTHLGALSYDPSVALGLDLIAASPLSLDAAETAVLAERGFVISRQEFPTFGYGYASIYAADLPVFISADMLLEAVHRSYDGILASLEFAILKTDLERLLRAMRGRLASGEVVLHPSVAADVDIYLTVAQSLLIGSEQPPREAALASTVHSLYEAAVTAAGAIGIELFGVPRVLDASQFEPRGHYAGGLGLETYFRAMIWLGRTDFRLIETQPDGSQLFRPRQLQAAVALNALVDAPARAAWARIDRSIGLFLGEHDDMTLPELSQLLEVLGVESSAALAELPDSQVAEAIAREGFGEQRIASRIIMRAPGAGTYLLDSSFAFFGQRYTVDSHVFSNLVYDRVGRGSVPRVVPDPLDVAFAALDNDQASSLLSGELSRFDYAGDLAAMRLLVDAHPADYWQSSLYTSWLAALRTLSPAAAGTALDEPGLPEVARTETWGRRLLNTQLASWAQLRHDTLLYAKQSYTAGAVCEFPDAYVDPYPEFFHALARFAERGRTGLLELDPEDQLGPAAYFRRLGEISGRLAEMAEFQRTGQPHTQEQLDFINEAVQVARGCAGDEFMTGWYSELYFGGNALEFDPTIADVHTDPGGTDPPRGPSVLHVGTGNPRLMVVTRETCAGPRAYAGVAFSYHEHLTDTLERLDDTEWQARIMSASPPATVPWLAAALPASAP